MKYSFFCSLLLLLTLCTTGCSNLGPSDFVVSSESIAEKSNGDGITSVSKGCQCKSQNCSCSVSECRESDNPSCKCSDCGCECICNATRGEPKIGLVTMNETQLEFSRGVERKLKGFSSEAANALAENFANKRECVIRKDMKTYYTLNKQTQSLYDKLSKTEKKNLGISCGIKF